MIKYSIIIAAYNAEQYLVSCIHSVLNQTYKNYEIIVVNDGSTDSTASIVEQMNQKYSSIIHVIQKNAGPFIARRNGAINSKGEYLLFLDSDDALTNNCLSVLNNAIMEFGSPDLVIFKDNEWDGTQVYESTVGSRFTGTKLHENKEEVCRDILAYKIPSSLRIKAVKRDIFLGSLNDIVETEVFGIRTAEDLLQTLPLVTYSNSILYLDEYIYMYRINENSIMHKFRMNHFHDAEIVYKYFEQYVKQWGLFSATYRDQYYKRYFNEIYSCVTQLKLPSCKLNKNEKTMYLKNISKSTMFLEYYKNMKNKRILGKKQAIILLLLKLRLYSTCLMIC